MRRWSQVKCFHVMKDCDPRLTSPNVQWRVHRERLQFWEGAIMTPNVGSRDSVKEHECGTNFVVSVSTTFRACLRPLSCLRHTRLQRRVLEKCSHTHHKLQHDKTRIGGPRNATMTRRDLHGKLLVVVCTWQVHGPRLCEEAEAVITAMLHPKYISRGGPHISRCVSGHRSARWKCPKSRR